MEWLGIERHSVVKNGKVGILEKVFDHVDNNSSHKIFWTGYDEPEMLKVGCEWNWANGATTYPESKGKDDGMLARTEQMCVVGCNILTSGQAREESR